MILWGYEVELEREGGEKNEFFREVIYECTRGIAARELATIADINR